MFYVDPGNTIRITKGNTADIIITPVSVETHDPIILEEEDYVLFTVKNAMNVTCIQRRLTSDDYDGDESLHCVLTPADTLSLPVDEYKYDCLLVTSDGQAITFISSKFVIERAVGTVESPGGDTNG